MTNSRSKCDDSLQHVNANANQQIRQINFRSNWCRNLFQHLNWLSWLCTIKVGPDCAIIIPVNVSVGRMCKAFGNTPASRVHAVCMRWSCVCVRLLVIVHITSGIDKSTMQRGRKLQMSIRRAHWNKTVTLSSFVPDNWWSSIDSDSFGGTFHSSWWVFGRQMISSFASVRAGVARYCDSYNGCRFLRLQHRTVDCIAGDNDDDGAVWL